ncbi:MULTISPECIES: YbaB/EbfC family nucleoid-associated protein [Actinokineospora]|uniref:YbaB/EbfC DNA-binding family protein n=2 Tax=Actinokineospora TaxID=39845 RepID=A0A421B5S0_9PSEU|nr:MULTISPECIES: YbaB/EbfC family nucleoid-associated protein [Actinokineospora]RLK59645.1 YbaB/EbfC DNA-binding family protein [Actinokineospora cianjurensis]SES09222.1 YbaB/EbfC DNA-binding family protein [Actinokineospora terrae]
MNPEQWLAQYDETLQRTAASAQKAEKALREVGGSATSADGDVTVRVSAAGVTTDLVLRPSVRELEPEQLARVILEVTRQAQRDAGARVVAAMEDLVGDSAALDVVKSFLPQGYAGDAADGPAAKPRERRSDDDYFDNPPEVVH